MYNNNVDVFIKNQFERFKAPVLVSESAFFPAVSWGAIVRSLKPDQSTSGSGSWTVGKVRRVRGHWEFSTLLPEAASLSSPRKGRCHTEVEALIQILLAIIGSKIRGGYFGELCVKCIEGYVLFRARIRCVQLHTVQWMTWNDSSLDTWAIKYPIKHLHASPSLYLPLPLSHFRPPLHLSDSIAMSSLFSSS